MNLKVNQKIPSEFKTLHAMYLFMSKNGFIFTREVCSRVSELKGVPSSANIDWQTIAQELDRAISLNYVYFEFYTAMNPFSRRNVISHATYQQHMNIVNYNRAFWGVRSFTVNDWIGNLFHELTHCSDQQSPYSYGHKNQSDFKSAPFVIGKIASDLYQEKYNS